MDVQVFFLTRNIKGDIAHQEQVISSDAVCFGRGTGTDVRLSDPRILLEQATITQTSDGFLFTSHEKAITFIDGENSESAIINPGTKIILGPYEILVLEPPYLKDLSLSIELVRPIDNGLEKMMNNNAMSLSRTLLSARWLSWGFVLLVLGAFLATPLYQSLTNPKAYPAQQRMMMSKNISDSPWPFRMTSFWNSGEISNSHKFLAHQCETCHQKPFQKIKEKACLSCHAKVQHHVEPDDWKLASIQKAACTTCHQEHLGPRTIVRRDEAFCTECHGKIQHIAKDTELQNVHSFAKDHPQFRPTVVVDASLGKIERIPLDRKKWPVEKSNMRFPHHVHVAPKGIAVPGQEKNRVLTCNDCHSPEPGGMGMQPIKMETHCKECHQLQFDSAAKNRELPHGNPLAVHTIMSDYYKAEALRKTKDKIEYVLSPKDLSDPKKIKSLFNQAAKRGEERTQERLHFVFNSVCGECHTPTPVKGNSSLQWTVEPVRIMNRWMPKGDFDHGRHRTMQCTECHVKTNTSTKSSDVLIPGIETCRQCHGGERAGKLVPSTCISCHDFHQPELSPMRQITQPKVKKATAKP